MLFPMFSVVELNKEHVRCVSYLWCVSMPSPHQILDVARCVNKHYPRNQVLSMSEMCVRKWTEASESVVRATDWGK